MYPAVIIPKIASRPAARHALHRARVNDFLITLHCDTTTKRICKRRAEDPYAQRSPFTGSASDNCHKAGYRGSWCHVQRMTVVKATAYKVSGQLNLVSENESQQGTPYFPGKAAAVTDEFSKKFAASRFVDSKRRTKLLHIFNLS